MNELAFMEIANEIKALHNGALEGIRSANFDEAEKLYRKCLQITKLISYHEGSAITLFSMANLAFFDGDLILAISRAEEARDYFIKAGVKQDECESLLFKLSAKAKKRGVALERSRNFQEAIAHFDAAIPHADEDSCRAMRHEVGLLRRMLEKRNGTDSRRAATAEPESYTSSRCG
ncbi:MAG: hypothetical protein A2X80_03785 [Geobacteraceae bacterium GWB2_52_12]|nr:MAG: hypothetical protein A2X80_03785 [Geobacteraceae bacterium GWB2_52_12]